MGVNICQNIKLYILNMYNLLYVNCTSAKKVIENIWTNGMKNQRIRLKQKSISHEHVRAY